MDDLYFSTMLESLETLLKEEANPNGQPTSTTQNDTKDLTIKCPIHGSFENSGNFSYSPSPRHSSHMGVDLRTSGGTSVYAAAPRSCNFSWFIIKRR